MVQDISTKCQHEGSIFGKKNGEQADFPPPLPLRREEVQILEYRAKNFCDMVNGVRLNTCLISQQSIDIGEKRETEGGIKKNEKMTSRESSK